MYPLNFFVDCFKLFIINFRNIKLAIQNVCSTAYSGTICRKGTPGLQDRALLGNGPTEPLFHWTVSRQWTEPFRGIGHWWPKCEHFALWAGVGVSALAETGVWVYNKAHGCNLYFLNFFFENFFKLKKSGNLFRNICFYYFLFY